MDLIRRSRIFLEGLIEQWTGNLTRFDLFYEECAPTECIYIIPAQRSRLAALLLLISICGGLNQVLRWFSLLIIQMAFYIKKQYRHRREQGKCMFVFERKCEEDDIILS